MRKSVGAEDSPSNAIKGVMDHVRALIYIMLAGGIHRESGIYLLVYVLPFPHHIRQLSLSSQVYSSSSDNIPKELWFANS